ncbi:uncharacterized protein LOC122245278 [Penaeus japonicus]|uniref:uncharacterized protein LOC122245278 n=1 Tax=Penaeus japonicus TaxID=27405 RepID=UPI001C7100E0|nr:uncharacterized protein LOC122245278 [Penaeus japonicus]
MSCYAYSHAKYQCPNNTKIVCSECAQEGHRFDSCPNKANPKCINCQGNHRALSGVCPIRKAAIKAEEKNKEKTEIEKETKTYRDVAKHTVSETLDVVKEATQMNILQLSDSLSTQILTILLHAHLLNLGTPGCFEAELKKGLERAGLPPVNLGNDVDSHRIFRVIPAARNTQTGERDQSYQKRNDTNTKLPPAQTAGPSTQPQEAERQPQSTKTRTLIAGASSQESLASSTTSHQKALDTQIDIVGTQGIEMEEEELVIDESVPGPSHCVAQAVPTYHSASQKTDYKKLDDGTPIDPKVLGLRLHAEDPKKYNNKSRKHIGEEIKKGAIKYTFNNPMFQTANFETKILKHLKQGEIELNFKLIEEAKNLKKIRNGYEETKERPEDKKKTN